MFRKITPIHQFLQLSIGAALLVMFTLSPQSGKAASPAQSVADEVLQDAKVIWNDMVQTPSFISGHFPVDVELTSASTSSTTAALHFLEAHKEIFGITNPDEELVMLNASVDQFGLQHVTFQQVIDNVPVYHAQIKVHLNSNQSAIYAVSSGFLPALDLSQGTVIQSEEAIASAQNLLQETRFEESIVNRTPTLTVYAGIGQRLSAANAKISWQVELMGDSSPAATTYFVDAHTGEVIDAIDHLRVTHSRDNQSPLSTAPAQLMSAEEAQEIVQDADSIAADAYATFTANGTFLLPGVLARSDDEPPTGDIDVDNAHEFAQATNAYFLDTHGRNSFDDNGAVVISTANYGRNYPNAGWTGTQMLYGDGFATLDVVAHELAHAVTQYTADLEYRWQSGALNESFSDIFGVMVDREDWLLGEDLPPSFLLGEPALRDMADPAALGQPAHTDDWVATCADVEGVHINSGIFNKAFYLTAEAISKEKAEEIFYRALTVYLQPQSSFLDARAKVLESAADIFEDGSPEQSAVESAFNDVGMTDVWEPEANSCTCAATNIALDPTTWAADGTTLLQSLYAVRDNLMSNTETGAHYTDLYYEHTGQISFYLISQPELRAKAELVLRSFSLGFASLASSNREQILVTEEMISLLDDLLDELEIVATAHGNADLATLIAHERSQITWDDLAGRTFADAWDLLREEQVNDVIYVPVFIE